MSIYSKDFIFIHIPKTAGKSIINSLSDYDIKIITNSRTKNDNFHSTIYDAEKELKNIDNYYKFSVVRNPWNRVTSWFLFRKKIIALEFKKVNSGKPRKLEKSLDLLYKEYQIMKEGLEFWLEYYKDDPWDFTWFKISDNQSSWLKGHNFNKIIKFEELSLEIKEIPFLKKRKINRTNQSINSAIDWKDLYSERSKKLVSKIYEEDIDNFKYTF